MPTSCRDVMQLCHTSRSNGEWAVAEGTLTTLVTAALGNENMCRRLLRVGLDQLIDAAEDDNDRGRSRSVHQETSTGRNNNNSSNNNNNTVGGGVKDSRPHHSKNIMRGAAASSSSSSGGGGGDQKMMKKKHHLPAMPGVMSTSPPRPRSPPTADPLPPRGPATDEELGLDQIDEIGVDGVLRQTSDALAMRMKGESRKTCSALATSLLQALGPFNYVRQSFDQSQRPLPIIVYCLLRLLRLLQSSGSCPISISAGLNGVLCGVFKKCVRRQMVALSIRKGLLWS